MTDGPPATPKAPGPAPGHGLLTGKIVVVTAAAGTGIGFATAKRCVEEGATVVLSDAHERRLNEAADALAEMPELAGQRPWPCPATSPTRPTCSASTTPPSSTWSFRRGRQQRRAGRQGRRGRHDRRAVGAGPRRHPDRNVPVHPGRPSPPLRPRQWRGDRQQRLGPGLAGPGRPIPHAAAKAGVMALTRCAAVEAVPTT